MVCKIDSTYGRKLYCSKLISAKKKLIIVQSNNVICISMEPCCLKSAVPFQECYTCTINDVN